LSASSLYVVVAGEVSGDLLASAAIGAILRRDPQARVAGVAGDRMIDAGCEPWHHVRELSVRGYTEVIRELPRLLRLRSRLKRRVIGSGCRVLVGVDSPDFNLGLETAVRRAGIPTVQYVGPSIWAWRAERIDRIRRAADRVLLVFPFEQRLYDRAGIPATYVGHPIAQLIPLRPDPEAARGRLGLGSGDGTLIAILPGSRRAEVDHVGPAFFGAADRLRRDLAPVRFVVPIAQASLRAQILTLVERHRGLREITTVVEGRSHDCLEACDAVMVASGTATLEAALFKRPMVIGYRVPPSSAWMMRKVGGYMPWIGLPNILAGESIVPELLQDEVNASSVADALIRQLGDQSGLARFAARFEQIHLELMRDTPSLVAEAVMSTADRRRSR
jgi:lipid-A-disaccharide synthase